MRLHRKRKARKCQLCGKLMEPGVHRLTKYHGACKRLALRAQKLIWWHANKEDIYYRRGK